MPQFGPDPMRAIVTERLDSFLDSPPVSDFQRGYLMALLELDNRRHPEGIALRAMLYAPPPTVFGKSCQEVLDGMTDADIDELENDDGLQSSSRPAQPD